jgi:hypothetical protein
MDTILAPQPTPPSESKNKLDSFERFLNENWIGTRTKTPPSAARTAIDSLQTRMNRRVDRFGTEQQILQRVIAAWQHVFRTVQIGNLAIECSIDAAAVTRILNVISAGVNIHLGPTGDAPANTADIFDVFGPSPMHTYLHDYRWLRGPVQEHADRLFRATSAILEHHQVFNADTAIVAVKDLETIREGAKMLAGSISAIYRKFEEAAGLASSATVPQASIGLSVGKENGGARDLMATSGITDHIGGALTAVRVSILPTIRTCNGSPH